MRAYNGLAAWLDDVEAVGQADKPWLKAYLTDLVIEIQAIASVTRSASNSQYTSTNALRMVSRYNRYHVHASTKVETEKPCNNP